MRGTARTGTPAAARSGRRSDAPRPRQARYEEIARALRQAILDGKFPVGTKLPKENALSAQFAVSRQTIRAALQILREQGLVVTRRRTGTIVTPHQTDGSNFIHALSINDLVSFSNRWHFTIDSVEERGIDQELAAWADVPDDRPWLAIAGVAQFDRLGLPECWTTYYLEPEYASAGDLLRDLHSPILPMIEATFGVSVAEIEQEISAILLPRAIAERISAVVDEPAISVRRVCRTEAGGIVLVAIEVFPTSRFRYRFVVGRDSHSKG
jgi:DNA-binding GntR family transcriptional regulator